ncbi:hypothetical protein [Dictyobacter kobayashii]|uniref:hypothetical protein n=1 Tax=Dictyobacter kobayashii TaxID=2014872 RepID=UPI000F818C64|nr:hypothetical protein [Dictyobacter kobayashii]
MGIHVAITPAELLLSILLLFLVSWTIVFAYLALKRSPESLVETSIPVTARPVSTTITQAVPSQLPKRNSVALQTSAVYSERTVNEAVLEKSLR